MCSISAKQMLKIPPYVHYIIAALAGVGILLNMMELISYLVLFRFLYNHDNHVAISILKPDVIKMRNSKNAISLVGQLSTWLLELSYTVLMFLYINLNPNEGTREVASICKLLEFSVIPLVQVLASSPLRKYVLDQSMSSILIYCLLFYLMVVMLLFE